MSRVSLLSAPPSPFTLHCRLRRLPRVTRYQVEDARWTVPKLRAVMLSDLHVCAPWSSLGYLERVVDQVNALAPDIIFLGGDYLADRNMRRFARMASAAQIVAPLTRLSAPLGIHGILGNHDWKGCPQSRRSDQTENSVLDAFAAAGMPLLRNAARAIPHGDGFWLVGTDSQRAIERGDGGYTSFLDADAAFAGIPAGAPVIHLAHEPDYFHTADPRAFLQISGHTHGGQIKLFGRTPVVPSVFKSRYAHGAIHENGNHLIVCAGLGFSGLPLRIGVPPEILLITVGS